MTSLDLTTLIRRISWTPDQPRLSIHDKIAQKKRYNDKDNLKKTMVSNSGVGNITGRQTQT